MDGKTDGFWNDTRLEKFVVHNYFTDKFYVSLGGYPEQNTSVTRRLVRKINIWVPIYDDGCFNYNPLASSHLATKKSDCGELADVSDVDFEIRCLTCNDSYGTSGPLTKFFKNIDPSHQPRHLPAHHMYRNVIARPMYHMVGPPGLYSIRCHRTGEHHYIGTGNPTFPFFRASSIFSFFRLGPIFPLLRVDSIKEYEASS